ncbi:hypothetical protein FNW52_14355 [Flavobacterium sp. ZT3R18]|uniref:hypothetical protein n=1 Tax=Flavobacterium sp. ZT3R18 TaxID=2594429 RepID=UPI00117B0A48|nr:hypothetical protein [Flavobacterium sp. ZT3R18]TRX34211.1 hypothetical protein FNW52_14355 [Flavobacterium sp. ZT3R18]
MKQISKIVALMLLFVLVISCSLSKERKSKSKENHRAYVNYLISRNIDSIKANDLDNYDEFFAFKEEQKRQSLLQNTYLKTNKVYVYQGNRNVITFCIYSNEGYLYMAEAYKTGGMFLTEPKDGIRQLKQKTELNFLGFFELEDTIFKSSRHVKTPFYEMNQSDFGYIKNDTITLTAYYNVKKSGGYKKKWLAKTHKTNYKFIYQPDLRAIKSKNSSGFDAFLIEGSFNVERNLEEEKMLQLLENVKY